MAPQSEFGRIQLQGALLWSLPRSREAEQQETTPVHRIVPRNVLHESVTGSKRWTAGETLGPQTLWDWHHDAQGKRVAHVSLAATAVLQHGPHAEKTRIAHPR